MSDPFIRFDFDNQDDWLGFRKTVLTASDMPAILGLVPWKSPLQVYAEKKGLMPQKAETEAMRFGKLLQPVIRQAYVEETGRQTENLGDYTLLVSQEHPWLGATLDYRILQPDGKPGDGALEAKSTGFMHKSEWEETPPERYLLQLEVQLLVTGWQWGSLAGLIGGQMFRWADKDADLTVQANIIEVGKEFQRRLELEDPPPADWTESSKAALKALFPQEEPTRVVLPPEAEEWHRLMGQAKEDEKDAKRRVEENGNLIRQSIGSASIGVLSGGHYTYRTQHTAGYSVAPRDSRILRFSTKK
jgi:putative phage-type endonuclease